MKQPLSRQEFEEIYTKVPRLTVEILLKTKRGIVLTMRQNSGWEGLWHIPGGTVYMGETLEKAVERVARRELGVGVRIKTLVGSITYPTAKQYAGLGWPVGIAFLVEITEGELGMGVKERLGFFKQLPEETIPEQREFLSKYDLAEG